MIARLASRKPRCHEALEGYVAAVGIICPAPPTVKRLARNSGAAIAGRSCYSTASSAAALGHLGAVHERGSGAKTARSLDVRAREVDLVERPESGEAASSLTAVMQRFPLS